MDIIACPNCGSKHIYQGTMGEGVLTGYTTRNVCKNCGYQGMPIIFDSEVEYKKFLEGKLKEKKSKQIKKKEKEKKEEKQIIKRPVGVTLLAFILILIAIITIYVYLNLPGSNVTSFIWIYYISNFVLSAIILPYGLIKGREWAWTVSGILFAMSIPIGLIFLYYITRPHVRAFFDKN